MGILTNKTIFLTGVTQGLGRSIAIQCAQQGANLILLGRDFSALESLDDQIKQYNTKITLIHLDLNEWDKIFQIGTQLSTRYECIDILVMNAAMLGTLSPLTHQDFTTWQKIFTVNVHANWLLLKTLEPLLICSSEPQVFGITTGLSKNPLPYWGGYAVSKAAFEYMLLMYAKEKKSLGWKVNCIDPGVMNTQLFKSAMPGADHNKISTPDQVAEKIIPLFTESNIKTGEIIKINETK